MNHADKRRKSWSLWSTKIVSLDPTLTVATVHKSRMLWQVHPSHAAKESNNQPQNHVAEREASWGSSCDREEMIIVQPRVKYRTLYTVLFCARCQVATNSHGKSRLATAAIRSALSFPTMAQSSAATGYAPSSSAPLRCSFGRRVQPNQCQEEARHPQDMHDCTVSKTLQQHAFIVRPDPNRL